VEVSSQLKEHSEANRKNIDEQEKILLRVGESFEGFTNQMASIVERVSTLIAGFDASLSANKQVVLQLESTTKNLNSSSNQLAILSSGIKEASGRLSDSIQSAVEDSAKLVRATENANIELSKTAISMTDSSKMLEQTSVTFEKAANVATDGLTSVEEHFDSLGDALKKHIHAVEKQIATLLNDYSEAVTSQVQIRMGEWNKQTNEFSDSMVKAVSSINDIVDEIETKVGS